MAKKEPKIGQPTDAQQRAYLSLRDNDPTIVHIDGRKKSYKLRWLKNGQLEKLGRLLAHKKKTDNNDAEDLDILDEITEDAKLACKTATIYLLDGFFKLKMFYWLRWRWYYYVRQYSAIQLMEILETGKKKIPLTQFLLLTMSLTEARDTLLLMTMREAERILREQSMEANSSTGSNSSGSSSRGTGSSA